MSEFDIVWAHGFGAHAGPGGDPAAEGVADFLAANRAANFATLHQVEVASVTDGIITPLPLNEQIDRVAARIAKLRPDSDKLVVAGQSQGGLVAALAVARFVSEKGPDGLLVLVPPLTSPRLRLKVPGQIRMWGSEIDVTQPYLDSLGSLDDPVGVIAAAAGSTCTRVAMAGNDKYLGPQEKQVNQLNERIAWLGPEQASVEVWPTAGHPLGRPQDHEAIAMQLLSLAGVRATALPS